MSVTFDTLLAVSNRCAHGATGRLIQRPSVSGELRFQVPRTFLESRSTHKVKILEALLNTRTATSAWACMGALHPVPDAPLVVAGTLRLGAVVAGNEHD